MQDSDVTIGETKDLSDIDILKIRLLYNFIAFKKELNAPECQKLFRTGSKFNSFVPGQLIIKPKRKPDKYTGNHPKQNDDVEYIDDEEAFMDKTSDIQDDSDADGTDAEAIINDLQGSTDDSGQENNDNINPQNLKFVKKGKSKKEKEDILGVLSDDHSGEIKFLKLKTDRNPLEDLSDYQSSEEQNRKDRILKEKHETLKHMIKN